MLGSRAEAHQLHPTRLEGAIVAEAVGMAEGAPPDIGNAFDVGVGVHWPNRARSQPIMVEDAKRPNPHLLRVAVTIEGKVPAGLEPPAVFVVDLAVVAYLQHGFALLAAG